MVLKKEKKLNNREGKVGVSELKNQEYGLVTIDEANSRQQVRGVKNTKSCLVTENPFKSIISYANTVHILYLKKPFRTISTVSKCFSHILVMSGTPAEGAEQAGVPDAEEKTGTQETWVEFAEMLNRLSSVLFVTLQTFVILHYLAPLFIHRASLPTVQSGDSN